MVRQQLWSIILCDFLWLCHLYECTRWTIQLSMISAEKEISLPKYISIYIIEFVFFIFHLNKCIFYLIHQNINRNNINIQYNMYIINYLYNMILCIRGWNLNDFIGSSFSSSSWILWIFVPVNTDTYQLLKL